MNLPKIISTQPQAVFAAAAGTNAFEKKVLSISIPRQQLDNWCWAAITEGLERAYGVKPVRTQCQIASATLGQTCCPQGANVVVCNRPHPLAPALGGIFRGLDITPTGRTFSFIRARIRGGFPVVAQIDWGNGGAGHVVVITGYRRVGTTIDLYVCDPYTGMRSEERFERFMTAFRDKGTWVASFETQGPRVRSE